MKKLKKCIKCRRYTDQDKLKRLRKTKLFKNKNEKLPLAPLCRVLAEMTEKEK